MKKISLLAITTLFFVNVFGQNPEVQKQIEEKKREYISEKLQLSEEDNDAFFKLYDEFHTKRKDLRIELTQNRMGLKKSTISDSEAREIIEKELGIKSEIVELEKEYVEKYYKILDPLQVVELYKAEEGFNKMMMERVRSRRGRNHSGNKEPDNRPRENRPPEKENLPPDN